MKSSKGKNYDLGIYSTTTTKNDFDTSDDYDSDENKNCVSCGIICIKSVVIIFNFLSIVRKHFNLSLTFNKILKLIIIIKDIWNFTYTIRSVDHNFKTRLCEPTYVNFVPSIHLCTDSCWVYDYFNWNFGHIQLVVRI
jgi:uncharacterized membrane protein YwaF